jgi:hypothetical protein
MSASFDAPAKGSLASLFATPAARLAGDSIGSVFAEVAPRRAPSTQPIPADGTEWSLQGWSGAYYSFSVHRISRPPRFDQAVYIMANWQAAEGKWRPIYIGQSGDLGTRIDQHEKLTRAIRLGARHLLVHVFAGTDVARLTVETDLRRAWNPPLNMHRFIGGTLKRSACSLRSFG